MSLNALVDLAVARETGAPSRQVRFWGSADGAAQAPTAGGAAPAGAGGGGDGAGGDANESPVTKVGSVLTTAIPTEVLAAYTAFVAGTAARFTPDAEQAVGLDTAQLTDLPGLRWSVFGVAVVAIVAYLFVGWRAAPEKTRRFPFVEMVAAVVAFVAWAFAMPGGLAGLFVGTDDLDTVSLGVAAGATLLLVGISAPMKKAASKLVG